MTDTTPQYRPKIGLFIDADNASPKRINQVIKHLSTYGAIKTRKAFGNWEKPHLKAWTKQLAKHAIEPVQQFDVTKQKNATDIALTIGVIDTLYNDNIDVFAIMSSDADFTPVVERLRSVDKVVVGFGEHYANQGFKDACSEFVVLDRKTMPKQVKIINNVPSYLLNTIRLAVSTCAKTHGQVNLVDVERLLQRIPTFTASHCNHQQLTRIVNEYQHG